MSSPEPPSTAKDRPALARLIPSVEFPVTLCVVCYGANFGLAERFLTSLYRHTDSAYFTLRAGLNEVEPATQELFDRFAAGFGNVEIYTESRNIFKNPLMRRLFRERTIASRWTLWCDDDTHFYRSDWLHRLAWKIERHPEVAQWGHLYTMVSGEPHLLEWIRAASWYRGIPFRPAKGHHPTESAEFLFATGGFWAAQTEVLLALDWPDPRLIQAAEDFMLGEALRQNQFTIAHFEYGVIVNDALRRNAGAPEVADLTVGL